MLVRILFIPILALALDPGDAARDAKQLQGSWDVVSLEAFKEKPANDKLKMMKITFKDDMVVFDFGPEEKETGTFKLKPSKNPRSMDVTLKSGNKSDTALFIYELKGDDLKLCWRKPGGVRPTEFSAKEADSDGLMILKRAK